MINRILVFILCKIFKVNARMLNYRNWRAAEPFELISKYLRFCPLVYTQTFQSDQFGLANLVLLYNGKIFLIPSIINTNEQEPDQKYIEIVPFALYNLYLNDDKNVLVKHIPTKLIIYFIKRNIKQIKNEKKEYETTYDVNPVFLAIREDLKWSKRQPYDRQRKSVN
jgi:hypothetical protein